MAQDDGYREIQLNGKQLIFLFMATTIVAVVIFLCGVTVGRGVRNATVAAGTQPAATSPTPDLAAVPTDTQGATRPAGAPPATPPPAPPPEADGAGAESAAGAGAKRTPPIDKPALPKGAAPGATTAGVPVASSAPPLPSPPASPKADAAAGVEPPGQGWAVQVGAYSDRSQADARARELLAKSYDAFIVVPPAGGGPFRVRVGKFKEKRQADAVLRRLTKEEKIKPFLVPPTR